MNTEIRLPAVWKGWTVTGLLGAGSYGRVYEIRREQYGVEERAAAKVISFPTDMDEVHEYISGFMKVFLGRSIRKGLRPRQRKRKLVVKHREICPII